MTGWIKLHRSMLDWEWFDDHNTFRLFLYILMKANFEPKNWHGIEIKRGQFLTSLLTLSEETGISVQSIRTSLTKLKSTGEVTDKVTNKNRLLTIVKYEEYQSKDSELTGKITNNQQTTNNQLTTTKETKETKEKKEDDFLKYKNTKFLLDKTSHYVSLNDRKFVQDYCNEHGVP